jgi:hypothetical protein
MKVLWLLPIVVVLSCVGCGVPNQDIIDACWHQATQQTAAGPDFENTRYVYYNKCLDAKKPRKERIREED